MGTLTTQKSVAGLSAGTMAQLLSTSLGPFSIASSAAGAQFTEADSPMKNLFESVKGYECKLDDLEPGDLFRFKDTLSQQESGTADAAWQIKENCVVFLVGVDNVDGVKNYRLWWCVRQGAGFSPSSVEPGRFDDQNGWNTRISEDRANEIKVELIEEAETKELEKAIGKKLALGHKPRTAIRKPTKKLELCGMVLSEELRVSIISTLTTHSSANRSIIMDTWGFAKTIEKGRGMALLFYGIPGTGKTKCAEIIAAELGLKFKLVGVDMIWSSEPGEAERTIKALFAGSKPDKTLLVFDECDSLVVNRKYSGQILGAITNTLLQCLERYDGITIFTTNRTVVLDPAFERRLQLKAEFPMPDVATRQAIWRCLIPEEAPLHKDVCFKTLASSHLAGGHIKNVVLNAARKAVHRGADRIEMAHFNEALKDELNGMAAFAEDEDDDRPAPAVGRMQMAANRGVSRGGGMGIKSTIHRVMGSKPSKELPDE